MYPIPSGLVWEMTQPDPDPWDESYYKAVEAAGRRYRKVAQEMRDKDERDRKWKTEKP